MAITLWKRFTKRWTCETNTTVPAKKSRLLETGGFSQLAKGRNGYYVYNIRDQYMGEAIDKYGEYSGLEADFLEQLCAPGDTVIEVGANIGALTVGIAMKVGPAGRVIAIEPQRIVFQTLCANIAINSLTNVECHWAAAGASHDTVTVPELDPNQDYNFGGLSLIHAREGIKVRSLMLDDFASLPDVRLVKIDVEGMENDVIAGGRQLISRHKPVIYVENNIVQHSEALMRLVDNLGYRMHWHIPMLFNPNNFNADPENIYPNVASFNMYCIHRDDPAGPVEMPQITDFTAHPLRRD